jgi:transcription elongation factor GreA
MDYVTADEKAKLEQELKDRIAMRRVLSERIGVARALGDLRENADYHAAKEDQGLNEAKIRQLEKRLAGATVADTTDMPADVVFLGATVTLRDIDSEVEEQYKLVGEASGNFDVDYIEVTTQSPIGMALMKARIGETIRADLPRGERRFVIIEISM